MATWSYDGVNTVSYTSTFADADQAANLRLDIDNSNESTNSSSGSIGAPVTLTVTDVNDLSPGDVFQAHVATFNGSGEFYTVDLRLFAYGTASSGSGYAFSWSYDGSAGVAVSIYIDATASAHGIQIVADDPNSTVYTNNAPGAPGTILTHTITDVGGLSAGNAFNVVAYVWPATHPQPVGAAALVFGTSNSGSFGGAEPDLGPRDDDNVQITIAPGQPILWTVKLYNQDGSSDPNSKYLVSEVRPENLHFVKNLGNVGTHEIDFELSLTALDTDGNVAVSHAFIGPYRTDFELLRSDLLRPVMAGVITNYGGASAGENHVKISGKDYMHWLETRVWPYDATLSYVDWPTGFRFKVAAADIGQIIKDILETVRDVSPNFPAAPGATLATRSFALDFIVDVDSVGKNINFEIGRFDPSTLYDIVTSLAGGSQDDGGFEFVMTVEKKFRLAAPALGDPDTPALELQVEVDTGFPNMTSTSQTNTGPEATHVLGVGAGTSQRQGGVNKHFRNNSSIFRRIDKVADFGDVKNLDALETLSSEALSFGAYPVHEVAVEVDPNQIAGFWTRTWPGKYANVVYDLGYARIPNEDGQPMKIVSMDCTVDLQGSETVVLGLNQKHDTSAFAGLSDW